MLLLLFRCQLWQIHHASINIANSILGGRRCLGILRISWSPTRYWISLRLWRCVMWISGWPLTNRGHLRRINDWIIQWSMHMYHRKRQLIPLWVNVLAIKALFITGSCSLPTPIFPVPLLWQLPTPFGRGTMNELWFCVGVVYLFFFITNIILQQTFWCNNCSCVWVSVPGIKLRTEFLSQYNPT